MNGLCECGCGGKTWIATISDRSRGWVKGEPVRFIHGHANKLDGAHNWRGDQATDGTKHKRAVRWFDIRGKQCERCGNPATERHHKDTDPGNNTPDNISFVCRKCHSVIHWELGTRTLPHPAAQPRPCVLCGDIVKKLSHGKCHKCAEYFRRNGVDRPNCPKDHDVVHNGAKPCPKKVIIQ